MKDTRSRSLYASVFQNRLKESQSDKIAKRIEMIMKPKFMDDGFIQSKNN